jgi:hypothetical protein
MPDLSFAIEGVEAPPYAAAPLLAFKLRITNADAVELVQTVALRCQVQIEATRRRYDAQDHERLRDLFGEPARWSRTVRTLLWTHVSVVVPPFTGSTLVDLPVPCTYDFNVASAKYFYALEEGDVPLAFLFSGSVFYAAAGGALQVTQIPWDREATYRLPVHAWREMMDLYYPNSAWMCLRQDVFDRLYRYKLRLGLPTWEQTLETLLAGAAEEAHT